ncbi:MAG: PIN domain-containing protein [Balneolaceae bacterium]
MTILIDTGPLYAVFDHRDQWHGWSVQQFGCLNPPFVTCEAVVTETIFLLNKIGIGTEPLFNLMNRNLLQVEPILNSSSNQRFIQKFISNYKNLPASVADSCLMFLSEHEKDPVIFTLDSDFTIYRMQNGNTVNLIIPKNG